MTKLDETYTVLVVDDEPDLRQLYQTTLQRAGYTVLCADGVVASKTCLKDNPNIACVVTDYRMQDGTGIELAHYVSHSDTPVPIVMMTAYGSPDHAVQALKAGAFDYLSKPVAIADLRTVVAQMVMQYHLHQCNDPAAVFKQISKLLPSQSPVMQKLHQQMAQCAVSLACVVIHGQSGTGKTLAARAIHAASVRHSQPFIVFDCAAQLYKDDDRVESALFNVQNGAFKAAHGGTLLLLSPQSLPIALQATLLNVLQNRCIEHAGGQGEGSHAAANTTPTDVRLMVSTTVPLLQALSAGQLRQDLYYRLDVLGLLLPELHDRVADHMVQGSTHDAVWLAQRWLAQHPQGKSMSLTDAAMIGLSTHRFDGNIRELENALERSVALCAGQNSQQLNIVFNGAIASKTATSNAVNADLTASNSDAAIGVAMNPALSHAVSPALNVQFPLDLTAHLATIERGLIEQALLRSRYNRSQAATLLGLNLRQLRYRIEQLGIED